MTVSCVDLMLWLTVKTDATETPDSDELRQTPLSAKCIYEGISLHIYFASTRILKRIEPLAFLLNCFVVVETKGEMQCTSQMFQFFSRRASHEG